MGDNSITLSHNLENGTRNFDIDYMDSSLMDKDFVEAKIEHKVFKERPRCHMSHQILIISNVNSLYSQVMILMIPTKCLDKCMLSKEALKSWSYFS